MTPPSGSVRHRRLPIVCVFAIVLALADSRAEPVAFSDDFDQPDGTLPVGWYFSQEDRFSTDSNQVKDQSLRMERNARNDSGTARRAAYAGESSEWWSDYAVEAMAVNSHADNRPGLIGRWQGPEQPNQAYVAYVRNDRLTIEKDLDGPGMGKNELNATNLSRPIRANERLRLRFAFAGDRLKAEVFAVESSGEEERLGSVIAADATYSRGSAGLVTRLTFRSRFAEWDAFEVIGASEPPAEIPPETVVHATDFAWFQGAYEPSDDSPVAASEWTDSRVETRIRSTHLTNEATRNGIILRYQEGSGPNNGNRGYHGMIRMIDADTVELRILRDFENTVSQTSDAGGILLGSRQIELSLLNDVPYELVFEAAGPRLVLGFSRANAEHKFFLHAEDSTYRKGAPGLRTHHAFHNRRTLWDEFSVVSLDDDPFSPSNLWRRQWSCGECVHRIEENSSLERSRKSEILNDLRSTLAEKPVRPMSFDDFTDYDTYIDNLRIDGRFGDLIELEANDPGMAYQTALQRLAALSSRFHWVLGEDRCTDATLRHRIFQSIVYYGQREADHPGQVETWHQPSFLVPSLATSIFYFIIEDTIFCLGAGIEDHRPKLGGEVWTTLNNTAWRTDLAHGVLSRDDEETWHPGQSASRSTALESVDSPVWTLQDNILDAVIPSVTTGSLELAAGQRNTHWEALTNRNIPEERLNMFRLSVNHGAAPTNGSYGYLMYLGNRSPKDYLNNQTVKILANTRDIQAIASADENVIQAIFYDETATLHTDDWTISVSDRNDSFTEDAVEWSSSLGNDWTSAGVATRIVEETADRKLVEARTQAEPNPALFFRLRLSLETIGEG